MASPRGPLRPTDAADEKMMYVDGSDDDDTEGKVLTEEPT